MKLSSIVLISSASAGRADKCNNIISFLETQGLSAENRVHRRITEFKEDLFPIVKERAEFCGASDVNERVDLEELDDVEQRMSFDNVDNKVQYFSIKKTNLTNISDSSLLRSLGRIHQPKAAGRCVPESEPESEQKASKIHLSASKRIRKS